MNCNVAFTKGANRQLRRRSLFVAVTWISMLMICAGARAQSEFQRRQKPTVVSRKTEVDKVIIDTDIGYDIDDAFALALALDSPELEVVGITTSSGDTLARAKIIDRMLGESGHESIPVAVGISTSPPIQTLPPGILSLQRRYGESGRYVRPSHPEAVDFMLEKIRQYPDQISLVTIGPLTNVGALIDRDAEAFHRLKRVVMMGGQINPVASAAGLSFGDFPEYNILLDVHAAQKLFNTGVPIYVMTLDATIDLRLDEVKRQQVFSTSTPLTDSLALLYLLWNNTTPVLFDAMAVTFAVKPDLCPVKPMHLTIEDTGVTKVEAGPPNAQVCSRSNANVFFDYFMPRITGGRNSTKSDSPMVLNMPGAP